MLKWAIADNTLRNSKEGHIQGKLYVSRAVSALAFAHHSNRST